MAVILSPKIYDYPQIVHTTLERPLTYLELKHATSDGAKPLFCLITADLDDIGDDTGSIEPLNDIATNAAFGDASPGGEDYRFKLVGFVDDLDLSKICSPLAGTGVFLFFCGSVSTPLDDLLYGTEGFDNLLPYVNEGEEGK